MLSLLNVSNTLDILIVAAIIYLLFIFIKQTRSYFILYSLIGLLGMTFLSEYLDLGLTRKILDLVITFFLVIFVIVFQREIRRFFRWLALSGNRLEKRVATLDETVVSYLTASISDMAKRRTGAIIVLSGEYPLDDIIEGGFALDGKITPALLLSIFDDSTPGHDGAVLIENRRISKFGVHLPLAEEFKGFATMGTRHRAATGITERTDAMAIVISEERGTISVAQGGSLRSLPDAKSLQETLLAFFQKEHLTSESVWYEFAQNNNVLKIASVLVAASLWYFSVFQASIVTKDISVPFEFQRIPDGLQVFTADPAAIVVTVTGNNQDIQTLKEGDIRAAIDLRDRGPETFEVSLSENDITKPSYVNIVKLSPGRVQITLQPRNVVQVVESEELPSEE